MTHKSCDSVEMAFAEIEVYLEQFPYTVREDMFVVEVPVATYDATQPTGMQLMADAVDTMMDDYRPELDFP